MNDIGSEIRGEPLILEYRLDAPPEKVWRALGIPELREQWLPQQVLADAG